MAPAASSAAAGCGTATILVVEDDQDLLDAFTLALRVCGYDVLAAGGGEAALAAVEQCGRRVDVVLTDVVMPDMDGVELVRRLQLRHPSLQAVYMSGYPEYVLARYGLAGGHDGFLHKPFPFDLLERKLQELIVGGGAAGEDGGPD